MEQEEEVIYVSGSGRIIANNTDSYLQVKEGTAYVYITRTIADSLDRSLFLCECNPGDIIPPLAESPGTKSGSFELVIMAKDTASLLVLHSGIDRAAVKKAFLDHAGIDNERENSFEYCLKAWYVEELIKERRQIADATEERRRVQESKLLLMGSLFQGKNNLNYSVDTDSLLYNAMAGYCGHLGIHICSYQALQQCYGDTFTVFNIASLSHFALRKVALEEKWYKKNEESILVFQKEGHKPLICIPAYRGHIAYSPEEHRSWRMNEETAKGLEPEGYVAYEHLPDDSLKLHEVISYGIRHIRKSDAVRFVVMYVFTTLCGLLLPFMHEMFYDTLIPLGKNLAVYQAGLVMFAVMVANIFFALVQNLASFRGIKKMEYSIVAATFDRIFRLPESFLDSFGTLELVNRTNAIPAVFSSTVSSGASAVMGLILSVFYVWHMFEKSKSLAIRAVIVTLISGLVMYLFGMARVPAEKERQKHSTSANTTLYQMISGIMKIKSSGIENRGLYEFQKENTAALSADIDSSRIRNFGNSVNTLFHMLSIGLIYYVLIRNRASLSIGEYSSFAVAYGFFTGAVQQVIGFFLTVANLIPVIDRIRPIYEEKAETASGTTVPGKLSGSIEIDHLSFRYPSENNLVLHNICMRIEPGEYIGIVGPSGCGKSTLMKCMLGFEKPTVGKIYYDEKDVDTLDKTELRRQVGAVLQDGQLVMGTILTNVTLAVPDLPVEEVEEVLKDAAVFDEINEMPMGIYTTVSDGEGSVSGGQKQRILIARALASNPKIVLFDEATSALDNITQRKVCRNLERRQVTRIMIAHRISTVRECDRIYVIDHGEIAETGSYEELMAKKGKFYEFAQRQVNVYE